MEMAEDRVQWVEFFKHHHEPLGFMKGGEYFSELT
jgi:hypothetical protein